MANQTLWWERKDSNLRRLSQRIYSPPPLPLGTLSHVAPRPEARSDSSAPAASWPRSDGLSEAAHALSTRRRFRRANCLSAIDMKRCPEGVEHPWLDIDPLAGRRMKKTGGLAEPRRNGTRRQRSGGAPDSGATLVYGFHAVRARSQCQATQASRDPSHGGGGDTPSGRDNSGRTYGADRQRG